jgi:phenylalanyl-tRNA synthetase beta chain
VTSQKYLPSQPVIAFSPEESNALLGVNIPPKTMASLLSRFNMKVKQKTKDRFLVTPPTYRTDVQSSVDLVEEIARIYGYHRIPEKNSCVELTVAPQNNAVKNSQVLRQVFKARDYHEVISYSFIDRELYYLFHGSEAAVVLKNPISSDMSVMRGCLWPSLVQVLQYNLNRQQLRARLFEIGSRYGAGFTEEMVLSGLIYGDVCPEEWGQKPREVDFYDVKSDLEACFKTFQFQDGITFRAATHHALHPGQSAVIEKNGQLLGYIGALHPQIKQKLGLHKALYLFEIHLKWLQKGTVSEYHTLSKFPFIRRDLSLIVKKETTYAELERVIKKGSGDLLANVVMFDLYQAEIENGSSSKSIAVGIFLQHSARTLVLEEVDKTIERILQLLERELSVKLRT